MYVHINERNCVYESVWAETKDFYFSGMLKGDAYSRAKVEKFEVYDPSSEKYEVYRKTREDFDDYNTDSENLESLLSSKQSLSPTCFNLSCSHQFDSDSISFLSVLKDSNWRINTYNWEEPYGVRKK